MQRIVVALVAAAVLAGAGVAAVAVGARTVGDHPPARHATTHRQITAPDVSASLGQPCFISMRTCSEIPCVVYVQSTTAAALVGSGAAVVPPVARRHCPRSRGSVTGTAVYKGSAPRRVPGTMPSFGRALRALQHKLSSRFP